MNDRGRVVVGMSGGVDSSVAAALLAQQGYAVIGVMLRLWSEPGSEKYNRCCTPDAMAQARKVASQLGIPFYVVDVKDLFREKVVQAFIDGYSRGITPNPCLVCNRRIRWGFLYEYAMSLGADYMSTGHYARIIKAADGICQLHRGVDTRKDQSYVLSVLNQTQLSHTLLPLGPFEKPAVRQMARDFGLEVAERAESQDLCFLAGEDYRTFLQRYSVDASQPGPIMDNHGQILGEHQGLAFYTIGQRKGLGFSSAEPYYVMRKDMDKNTVVVGTRNELGVGKLYASSANWLARAISEDPFRAQVKIRYKAEDAWGLVTRLPEDRFQVDFDQPKRDITAGQGVVVYQDDLCLGSGMIEQS